MLELRKLKCDSWRGCSNDVGQAVSDSTQRHLPTFNDRGIRRWSKRRSKKRRAGQLYLFQCLALPAALTDVKTSEDETSVTPKAPDIPSFTGPIPIGSHVVECTLRRRTNTVMLTAATYRPCCQRYQVLPAIWLRGDARAARLLQPQVSM